jgi:hypothetical protein
MRVKRLVAGVVCLGLAAIAAAWGVEHRAWYDEVDRLGQRTVKGAELVKTGPVDGRAARVGRATNPRMSGSPSTRPAPERGRGRRRALRRRSFILARSHPAKPPTCSGTTPR